MDLDSRALALFGDQMQEEYRDLLEANKREMSSIEGFTMIHDMLLERYTFVYVAMKTMEKDWRRIDPQRYNQLMGLWIKLGNELLGKYRDMVAAGALKDVFIKQVLTIVGEEVADSDKMQRIRTRLQTIAKEDQ